jgi:hypothetical protein
MIDDDRSAVPRRFGGEFHVGFYADTVHRWFNGCQRPFAMTLGGKQNTNSSLLL